jgi:hypothetical protein
LSGGEDRKVAIGTMLPEPDADRRCDEGFGQRTLLK